MLTTKERLDLDSKECLLPLSNEEAPSSETTVYSDGENFMFNSAWSMATKALRCLKRIAVSPMPTEVCLEGFSTGRSVTQESSMFAAR